MLLSGRRLGLLIFCLAGMEIAWITPFFLLFYRPLADASAWVIFVGLFGTLLVFILALELLNLFQVDWPFYELVVVGLILVTSLLFVRVWLYGGMPVGDLRWLSNTLGAVIDFHQGIRPELVLILTSVLLWQRAAHATSRDVGFFGVGFSFRLGLLLLILGAGILSLLRGQDARPILWLFLALGLTAVALARTREKAIDAGSVGAMRSLPQLGQLLLAVGTTVGAAIGVSFLYTPDRIKRTLLLALRPLWPLLSPVLRWLLQALVLVLKPILLGLAWLFARLFQDLDWTLLEEIVEALGETSDQEQVMGQTESMFVGVPAWVWTGLRYVLLLLAILVLVGFVLLFLNKLRRQSERDEAEETGQEEITFGGTTLGRGLHWLRDMLGMVSRFGLSRQLLAAISVQNIYANLCRLARGRGYPRHPAQPPDDYLPVLARAFPSQEEALSRITTTYMRVHYGDQSVTAGQLAQLRQDYHQVRRSQ